MDEAQSREADAWSRVTVITVSHHSGRVIGACLASVAPAARVVLVDNASDDDTLAIAAGLLPSATLIRNRVNRGFGAGCNQGFARVETEFALLIGPDSTIDGASLADLVAAADAWPDAGLLGPAIVAPDGHIELSHDLGLFERMTAGRRLDADLSPEGPLCAGNLSGALLLVRMTALRQVGGFDPAIFLYYEDDDLCLRFAAAGWSLVLVPAARATHIGGGSSRLDLCYHWKKYWHYGWSRLHMEAKYRGRPRAAAIGLGALLRYAGKAVANALALKPAKAVRDAARFTGSAAWLLGLSAMPATD